jgi:penicillin-binding protein A
MAVFRRTKEPLKHVRPPDWRTYQRRLQRERRPRRWTRFFWLGVLLLVVAGGFTFFSNGRFETPLPDEDEAATSAPPPVEVDKPAIQALISPADLFNRSSGQFTINGHGRPLLVETTLDMDLQRSLVDALDPRTARYIAVVAVDPETGRVLAMAGYDRDGQTNNPCLDNRFPAASLFKIVTAAAAVEEKRLNGSSEVHFNGGRYTLYRNQIKDDITRYTTRLALRDAFAGSVNPVFGKLGALRLGMDALTRWAEAFGFNQPIPFEAPLAPSHFEASADAYHLAELASGFNRQTTVSPLHAALIAAATVNAGRLYEPSAVARIVDADGQVRYESRPRLMGKPMAAATAAQIAVMMEASVRKGTCRKPFAGFSRDPVLRHVAIGGKSGSIDNRDHSARIDWFAGWAAEREGGTEIAVAAMVAHEKYIGTRAGTYARRVMTEYFGRLFAARKAEAAALGRAEGRNGGGRG